MDPWVPDFYPVLAWGFGTLMGRVQFVSVAAVDKNWYPVPPPHFLIAGLLTLKVRVTRLQKEIAPESISF